MKRFVTSLLAALALAVVGCQEHPDAEVRKHIDAYYDAKTKHERAMAAAQAALRCYKINDLEGYAKWRRRSKEAEAGW